MTDKNYFRQKLELVIEGLDNYTGDELARELHRLGNTASETVHHWTEAEELTKLEADKERFERLANTGASMCNQLETEKAELVKAICIYAREELGDETFESGAQAVQYFIDFAKEYE